MQNVLKAAAAGVAMSALAVTGANAAIFVVDAFANSTTGGTGVSTVSLFTGQSFSVTVDPGDLWNAGALPRWSNANGITGPDLIATGTDDSLEASGTVIGSSIFGNYTQGGLTAPYGTLVGQIGAGNFFALGTSFSGTATAAGTLKLFYFDSNNGDNSQFVTATVTAAVPEASTWAMMLIGFAGLAFASQRRRAIVSA